MREMQALGYHLGAIDTQNRLERYNEFKAQLPNEQREFLDSTVGKIWDGSFMEQIAENTSAVCSVATALLWATSIVQRPLLLVMVEAEVLAVIGVKRMTRMTSLSVADALEWLCT